MPSLIDLRRRIKSVKNTQQITKAMKMVSAAKLRRAQHAVVNSRPYSVLLEEMIGSVLAQSAGEEQRLDHPLLERRECRTSQLLLLAGEKGLCGSFNSNVFKAARQFLDGQPAKHVELELLGRKASEYFRHRGHPISGSWEQVFARVEYDTAREIAERSMERFRAGDVDEVWVLNNSFRSVLQQEVVLKRLLPVLPSETTAVSGAGYDYEQPPEELLALLLPKQVVTQLYVAMLESAAAEHAARMTAMDAATRNAGQVLEKLTLYLNRVRQASITTEIIEIVSGAAALE